MCFLDVAASHAREPLCVPGGPPARRTAPLGSFVVQLGPLGASRVIPRLQALNLTCTQSIEPLVPGAGAEDGALWGPVSCHLAGLAAAPQMFGAAGCAPARC